MSTKKQQVLSILILLVSLAAYVGAQSQTYQSYWHTSDYYSIQLDGAGNAFIGLEMNLQSISAIRTGTITLDIPYQNVTVYQVISEPSGYATCSYCTYTYPNPSYPNYNNNPQFVQYSTTSGVNTTYLTLHLNPSQSLINSSQTTIYVFLSARNVAQKTWQGFQFSFKTFVDPNALVRNAYASVEVPQNMYLAGEPTYNESYQTQANIGTFSTAGTAAMVGAAIPAVFYSPYQYQTSNLLPGEFFTITGLYGSNQLLLYVPQIVLVIIIIAIIALILKYWLLQKIKSIFAKSKTAKAPRVAATDFNLGRAIMTSMASGFLFLIAYYGLTLIGSLLSGIGYYYYGSPLIVLYILLAVVVGALALFYLPLHIYIKYNHKEGIVAGILSIIMAIVFAILIVIILYGFISPPVYGGGGIV